MASKAAEKTVARRHFSDHIGYSVDGMNPGVRTVIRLITGIRLHVRPLAPPSRKQIIVLNIRRAPWRNTRYTYTRSCTVFVLFGDNAQLLPASEFGMVTMEMMEV